MPRTAHRAYQGAVEQDNHLPRLASDAVIDALQDTVGPFGCLDTLLTICHQPKAPDHFFGARTLGATASSHGYEHGEGKVTM